MLVSGLDSRRRAPLTALVTVLALVVLLPAAARAADPVQVNFDLNGCDRVVAGASYDPDAGPPDLVCDDPAYVGGNLGKGWNELDLVPFRVTAKAKANAPASQTYVVTIAVDHKKAGVLGFDALSVPVLNTAKSSASCTALTASPETILSPGMNGADETVYRKLTITQLTDTTCVYDYTARLAVGSHDYDGSSLHANLANEELGSAGVGSIDRSLPVKEIEPQGLDKTMEASRDADHMWSLTKQPTPASIDFGNSCDYSAFPASKAVGITVTWEILAATPDGDVNLVTKIYATNPAARIITVNVDDQIYEGTTQTTTVGGVASSGPKDVPANTANFLVLTHTLTVNNSSTHFNDVATATYTDKLTGVPVPGTTTASADAAVAAGAVTNASATIADTESITGAGLSFAVDSVDPDAPPNGAFDGFYTLGTVTTGPVGWTSFTQTANGSVTFNKTIYLAAAANTSGTLTDTANLTGSEGFTANATANVSISASATVTLTIEKTIPAVLQTGESETFTFHVLDASQQQVGPDRTITFTGGGALTKTLDISGLDPGKYTVTEDTAPGWNPQDPQDVDLSLPTCSGKATFVNGFAPATASAKKITVPSGNEAGWAMTLEGPGTGANGETVNTDASGDAPFTTVLAEGDYTITETAQSGWDAQTPTGECEFTVNYPEDSGHEFACTFTNVKRGSIKVQKQTEPDGDAEQFAFTGDLEGSIGDGGEIGPTSVAPGTYSTTEAAKDGWDLTSISCSDDDSSGVIATGVATFHVAAGEDVTCVYTNRKRGHAKVIKTVSGLPPTGTQAFTFQLRTGASATANGTVVETLVADANNGGVITFTTLLVPGAPYQMCEIVQPGWQTNLGTFVPGSFIPPDGLALNPTVDNSILCVDFTVAAGETKTFLVDNTPPPGGRALTIGFWKNWASCGSGKQKPTLDETLALFPIASGQTTHGVYLGRLYVDTCIEAVRILDKSTVDTGKKQASDPLYNMAAQLMAVLLNLKAGAGYCGTLTTNKDAALALLDKYKFDGVSSYTKKLSAADTTLANQIAKQLDLYNNDLLC